MAKKYVCSVCGATLSTKKGPESPRHINSNRHQTALGKIGGKIDKSADKREKKSKKSKKTQRITQLGDSDKINRIEKQFLSFLLYSHLSKSKGPDYSSILSFFSSFDVKTEETLRLLIYHLKANRIVFSGNMPEEYNLILKAILNDIKSIQYPIVLNYQEFYDLLRKNNLLKKFRITAGTDYEKFLLEISKKIPGFIILSSSHLGNPPDLVTIKEIFPNTLKFRLAGSWMQ